MPLLTALLLATAPVRDPGQTWTCSASHFIGVGGMSVWMPFWGPNDPMLRRPYLSISVGRFSYGWKRNPRLLEEPYRDPNELAFPVHLERQPRRGDVVLTASHERPIRIPMGRDALSHWDVWHGAYLRLKDGRAIARLLTVPGWTATVVDRSGRVQEVTALAFPSRDGVRSLYDEARSRMLEAARDPAGSPSCKRDDPSEDLGSIV